MDIENVRDQDIRFDEKHVKAHRTKKEKSKDDPFREVCHGGERSSRLVGEAGCRSGWWCKGDDQSCDGKARHNESICGFAVCRNPPSPVEMCMSVTN